MNQITAQYNDKYDEIHMIKLYLVKDVKIDAIYFTHASLDEITNLIKAYQKPIPILAQHESFILRFEESEDEFELCRHCNSKIYDNCEDICESCIKEIFEYFNKNIACISKSKKIEEYNANISYVGGFSIYVSDDHKDYLFLDTSKNTYISKNDLIMYIEEHI